MLHTNITMLAFLGLYEFIMLPLIFFLWLGIAILIGRVSENGALGFWPAFLAAFFLTFIVGVVVALISISREKEIDDSIPSQMHNSHSSLDDLERLNSLKEQGAISDMEYEVTKRKILKMI